MRVSDENVADLFFPESFTQRDQVAGIVRARINHRDVIAANNHDTGALERERAGIRRQQSLDKWAYLQRFAVRRVKLRIERHCCG